MSYEKDDEKEEKNKQKHRVDFEEAASVLKDAGAFITYDDAHSTEKEDRFIAIGYSAKERILLVVYCERFDEEGEEFIRIISARKADKRQRKIRMGGL